MVSFFIRGEPRWFCPLPRWYKVIIASPLDPLVIYHLNFQVAGWGLTGADGIESPFLKVVHLPYISIQECQSSSPPDFRAYITGDKICAGFRNGE